MALAAGLPPPTVAAMTARELRALEGALERRWGDAEELLAKLCELVHALILVQLARAGVRNVGPPLQIRRSTNVRTADRPKPHVQTGRQLVAALGRTRGGDGG